MRGFRAVGVLTALALSGVTGAQVVEPAMIGRWDGMGQVVVPFPRQRTLPVTVVIVSDDDVSGSIGDAEFHDGRFREDPDPAGSLLRWRTRYVITANLEGPVIRAENIWRTSVRIALNWVGDHFEGGLTTNGWTSGGREWRAVAASLTLFRPVNPERFELDGCGASLRCAARHLAPIIPAPRSP
jgi:hypothetical protein